MIRSLTVVHDIHFYITEDHPKSPLAAQTLSKAKLIERQEKIGFEIGSRLVNVHRSKVLTKKWTMVMNR